MNKADILQCEIYIYLTKEVVHQKYLNISRYFPYLIAVKNKRS